MLASSIALHHEAVKECREIRIPIERKNMRDILVWAHDDDATPFSIDATHVEDVVAASEIGAEHFLVVTKRIPALPG